MAATKPIIHFVGSIPLPDSETVFKTLSQSAGAHLARLPDGETGIRKSWIRFLQDVLAQNPAIEVASDVPPFKFTQWDGKVVREIPRLRIKQGMVPAAGGFVTNYGDMAIASWKLFEQMQKAGAIPAGVKFQVSLPTPIAPTYNNMVPADRPRTLRPSSIISTARWRRSRLSCRMTSSRSNGMSARRCSPGKAITMPARSISAPRRSTC